MQNGFYSATGGIVSEFNRLDVIANNLANANTNAFKRDDVVVGDFLRLYELRKHNLPLDNHTRDTSLFLNRSINRVPQVVESYRDGRLGALNLTGNPLDLALTDEGTFFVVETPQGLRYTRDGAFKINHEGLLVNSEGFKLLNSQDLNMEESERAGLNLSAATDINIDPQGNVQAIGGNEVINLGQIAIVKFSSLKHLSKAGNNLYTLKDEFLSQRSEANSLDALKSGFIEKSNVNPVLEMSALINTNRLVEMYSKVLKTHQDDLNTDAINKLAGRN